MTGSSIQVFRAAKRKLTFNRHQISEDDEYDEEEVDNGTADDEVDSETQVVDVEEHSEPEIVESLPMVCGNRRRNQRH